MRGRILVTLGLLAIAVSTFAAIIVVVRLTRSVPPPRLALSTPASVTIGSGPIAPLPLPAQGTVMLRSSVDGDIASRGADEPRPIGSVAKTMTALVTLDAKPLSVGDEGPTYVIAGNDVALYNRAVADGGSTVAVSAGERFSERQMLLALLLPSANNLAESLALWVSGDRVAFLARLNARAAELGMSHTHFDDPDGFLDTTVSSAGDLVKLGDAVLANPALSAIVAMQAATLPDGSVVPNLDSNLRQPGWLGIKTGSTNAAGGCLLFAAQRTPTGGGDPVRVVGAILGQPQLGDALSTSLAIANAALMSYIHVDLLTLSSGIVGSLSTDWGDGTTTHVVTKAAAITARSGTLVTLTTEDLPLATPLTAGSTVARIHGAVSDREVTVYELQTTATVNPPGAGWRLTH